VDVADDRFEGQRFGTDHGDSIETLVVVPFDHREVLDELAVNATVRRVLWPARCDRHGEVATARGRTGGARPDLPDIRGDQSGP
jgi:hypothetical protein